MTHNLIIREENTSCKMRVYHRAGQAHNHGHLFDAPGRGFVNVKSPTAALHNPIPSTATIINRVIKAGADRNARVSLCHMFTSTAETATASGIGWESAVSMGCLSQGQYRALLSPGGLTPQYTHILLFTDRIKDSHLVSNGNRGGLYKGSKVPKR